MAHAIALVLPAEGSQNLGNTMICEATERILERVPFSGQVERFSYLRRPTAEELERINSHDRAIFVGTNIFQPHVLGWEWQPEDWRQVRIPYSFYGVGYSGPLQKDPQDLCPEMRELISWSHGAEGLGVRDPETVRWLSSFDMDSELIGCPVLAYADSFSKITPAEGRPVLAVRGILLHDPGEEAAAAQRMMVDWFFEECPDGVCVVQEHADLKLLGDVRVRTCSKEIPVLTDPEGIIQALSQAKFVLTARLHAGMLALSFGRPAVLLAHDTRVASFCDMIGLPSRELSFQGLKESIEAVCMIERGDLSEFREADQRIPRFRWSLEEFLKKCLQPVEATPDKYRLKSVLVGLQAQVPQLEGRVRAQEQDQKRLHEQLQAKEQTVTQTASSLGWHISQSCWRLIGRALPPRTRRRWLFGRALRAGTIVQQEGFGGLWKRLRQRLRPRTALHSSSLTHRIDLLKLPPKARTDRDKLSLMIVIPTMGAGGMERCTEVLLKCFCRDLFELELAMLFDDEPFYEIPTDVKVHILERYPQPRVNSRLAQPFPEFAIRHADEFTWLEAAAHRLATLIRERRPDVILAQDFYASAIALIAKQHLPQDLRIIGSMHNQYSIFLQTVQRGDLYAAMIQRYFNEAEMIIAVSQGVAQDLIENFGVRPEVVAVIHNPVDLEQIESLARELITEHCWFSEEIPILLFVGRLSAQKGLGYLLKAIALARQSERFRCVIIGDGEKRPELEALAQQLGVSEDVVFLGKRSNPFKFMHRATCFVLPSIVEGLPYVIPEAMACGCPIIATDCAPGVRELLGNGERGLLVPPKNPHALSAALLMMLRRNDLREAFSSAGLQYLQELSAAKTVKQYESLLGRYACSSR